MIPVEGALVVAQVLAHRTTDREVPSSFPTGSLAFSLLFSFLSHSISGASLKVMKAQRDEFYNFPQK